MALTKAQRERLQAIVQPMIAQEMKDLEGIVEDAVRKATSGSSTGYLDKILGSQPARSNKDLPIAARTFARLGMIQAASNGDRATALDLARTLDVEAEYKSALAAGSAEGGGLLITEDSADELIELLRPFSAMRRIGAIEVPIPRGTKRTPRIDVGVTSGYIAEGQAIPASELKTGSVVLIARKLATLIVFSNELAQFTQGSAFNVDAVLVGDMLQSMGATEDVAFLFGTGSEAEPLGITLQAHADNIFDATQAGAAATLDEVRTDLRKLEAALLNADVPMQRPVWLMSPRSRLFLRDIRDADDRGVFGEEMARSGTINGIPFVQTNNIANDGGSGSNESKVILVDAAEVMIGDVAQIGVDRSNQATVTIDGSPVNLFETDRSAVRTRQWNDIVLRHSFGCAVLEAVKWGA